MEGEASGINVKQFSVIVFVDIGEKVQQKRAFEEKLLQ